MHYLTEILQVARLGGSMVYPLALLAIVALAIILDRVAVFWWSARLPKPGPDDVEHGYAEGGNVETGDIERGYAEGGYVERGVVGRGYTKRGYVERGDAAGQDDSDLAVQRLVSRLPLHNVFRRLAAPAIERADAPFWWIEAETQVLASRVEREMRRGLWILETVVTAAPLLGLLGTIMGMMHSFQLIGARGGIVNPTGITGGVAQALIATAIGLVIAVASLFAFNYFTRRVDALVDELESFVTTLHGAIRLVREKAVPAQ